MSDLISRSDAIGAVKEERFPIDSDYAEGFMAALDKVEWILKEWLPSAQPETHDKRTKTHACDCIERQAAIDALDKRFDSIPMEQTTEILQLRKDLRKLPSAQPEQRYTEEELRVFQHGISLSLLSKRSSQHWQYDEDTATEIKFLERLYEKVVADMRGEQDGRFNQQTSGDRCAEE